MTVLSRLTEGVSALVVSTYFLAMALIILLLITTSIGQDLASHQGHLVLGAFLIPIYTPIVINLLVGFLVLFAIFVLCFVAAARNNGGFPRSLQQFLVPGPRENKLPNWLVVMPIVSSALVLLVVALTLIQDTAGLQTGSLPQLDPYQFLYTLAYAPPLEETMFRISTIGLLVALRTVWSTPSKNAEAPRKHNLGRIIALSFLSPEAAKSEAGLPTFKESGWHSLHWTEWLILLITSAGFGLAHILSGVGWEAGKVLPAAISGFALGFSYLLYGAYASILLHWFFNVYFEAYSLSSSLLGGLFVPLEGVIGLLTFVAGALGGIAGLVWLSSKRRGAGETTYTIPNNPSVTSGEGALYHRQVD